MSQAPGFGGYYKEESRDVTIPRSEEEQKPFDEFLAESWAECDKTYKPLLNVVFVRTDLPKRVSDGGIIMPKYHDGLSGGLPKGKTVWGTVLAVGPEAHLVKAGDRVAFPRGSWMWLHKMKDGSRVGNIKEEWIHLWETPEAVAA